MEPSPEAISTNENVETMSGQLPRVVMMVIGHLQQHAAISKSTVAALFRQFDTNKDDLLSHEELREALRGIDHEYSDDEWEEFAKYADMSRNGFFEYYELLQLWCRYTQLTTDTWTPSDLELADRKELADLQHKVL